MPAVPAGMMATSVQGSLGKLRWELFLKVQLLVLIAVAVPTSIVGVIYPASFCGSPSVFALCLFILIYNLVVQGPWRCFDASPPVEFELSEDNLTVTSWEVAGCWKCRRRTQSWPARDIEAVGVYMQEDRFGTCCPPSSCCAGGGGVAEGGGSGPQPIQSDAQVGERLPTWRSPLQLMCGTQRLFTHFFLGAQLRGVPEILPISRRVWHLDGLRELFVMYNRLRLFRSGGLLASSSKQGATLEAIASLPRRSYHAPGSRPPSGAAGPEDAEDVAIPDEAAAVDEEGDECAICLEVFQDGDEVNVLPCGHIFHCGCARCWLQVSGTCPMCKQDVSGGSLATPPPAPLAAQAISAAAVQEEVSGASLATPPPAPPAAQDISAAAAQVAEPPPRPAPAPEEPAPPVLSV